MNKENLNAEARPVNIHPEYGKNVTEAERKLISILLYDDWDISKLDTMDPDQKKDLIKMLNRSLNVLAGEDRELLFEKYSSLLGESSRNKLWQNNHKRILISISNLTLDKGRFPTRYEIANDSGLSQQTINKHLKSYFNSAEYVEKQDEYLIMREVVLAVMFRSAKMGDAKAAKVFLNATDQFTQPKVIKNQTNYIQINGAIITQKQLEELPEDKKLQLSGILSLVNNPAQMELSPQNSQS